MYSWTGEVQHGENFDNTKKKLIIFRFMAVGLSVWVFISDT